MATNPQKDFPCSSVGKEYACIAGELGLILGSGRSPGEGNGNPLQYTCLDNPMDRGAWQTTVHGVARVKHDLATTPPPPPTHKNCQLSLVCQKVGPLHLQCLHYLCSLLLINSPLLKYSVSGNSFSENLSLSDSDCYNTTQGKC